MKVGITGTPGTGKTTVSDHINREVIDLKEFAKKNEYGTEEQLYQVNLQKLREGLPENYWIEGHLAHKLDLDYCIVLRTSPEELRKRLEDRDYPDEKIRENVEAEAMDLILSEACQMDFPVYEIDTTEKSSEEAADEIEKAVENKIEKTGSVDWTDYF